MPHNVVHSEDHEASRTWEQGSASAAGARRRQQIDLGGVDRVAPHTEHHTRTQQRPDPKATIERDYWGTQSPPERAGLGNETNRSGRGRRLKKVEAYVPPFLSRDLEPPPLNVRIFLAYFCLRFPRQQHKQRRAEESWLSFSPGLVDGVGFVASASSVSSLYGSLYNRQLLRGAVQSIVCLPLRICPLQWPCCLPAVRGFWGGRKRLIGFKGEATNPSTYIVIQCLRLNCG